MNRQKYKQNFGGPQSSEELEFEDLVKLTEFEFESNDSQESPNTPITPITPASVVPLHIKKQISLEKSICDLKDSELKKLITSANIEKTEAEMREAERNYKVIDIGLDYFKLKDVSLTEKELTSTLLSIENPEESKTCESPEYSAKLTSQTPGLIARQADEDHVLPLNDDDF